MSPKHPRVAVLAAWISFVAISQSMASDAAPNFAADVLPFLTKAGCNTGECHGTATGQGGFHLSLLGYDSQEDYDAVTREFGGRRIDLKRPETSLLLLKATREIAHKGGRRIESGNAAHATILAWLEGGALYGDETLALTGLSIAPAEIQAAQPGTTVSLKVTALYNDGSKRDVSRLALYQVLDDTTAAVDGAGNLTVLRRGLTSVMIRFLGQVDSVRVAAPFEGAPFGADAFKPQTQVDRWISEEWRNMRITPAQRTDAASFLRRAHLDILGRLPTPREVRSHLSGPDTAEARIAVIEELVGAPEFVDFWTLKLADWLLIRRVKLGDAPAETYYEWVREQVSTNRRLDEFAHDLLTASGPADTIGPVNFHAQANDPRDLAEFVSRTLLGTQVACARCHNHPFDRWSQEDYHRFAAYFANSRFANGRLQTVGRASIPHPKSGRPLFPRPLGGPMRNLDPNADPRGALADWVTSPDNPLFARSIVNRVWKELFGHGLVEPVDDLRPTNPSPLPRMFEALAEDFVAHGYDLRRLIRMLAGSATYQLASIPSDGTDRRHAERLFACARIKPLTGHVLADALAQATGLPDSFEGQPWGARAIEVTDPAIDSYLLDVFGRCSRETACATGSQQGGGLAQVLHLINGPVLNSKLGPSVQLRSIDGLMPAREVIQEMYLASLSRFPTDNEHRYWAGRIPEPPSQGEREFLEDLLWALLNSREFSHNH